MIPSISSNELPNKNQTCSKPKGSPKLKKKKKITACRVNFWSKIPYFQNILGIKTALFSAFVLRHIVPLLLKSKDAMLQAIKPWVIFLSFVSPKISVDFYMLQTKKDDNSNHISLNWMVYFLSKFCYKRWSIYLTINKFKNSLYMLFGALSSSFHLSDIVSSGFFVELIWRSIVHEPNETMQSLDHGKLSEYNRVYH